MIFSTVARRLTLSYTLLFGLLSLGAFLLVYVHIVHNLNQQTDDRLRATIRELIKTRAEGGSDGLQEEFTIESTATGKERVFFRLLNPDGKPVITSDLTSWKSVSRFPVSLPVKGDQINRLHISGHEYPTRMITARLEDGFFLQAGVADDKDEVLESYRETFSTVFLLILVLGGIGAHLIVRRAMGGVREVTDAAARIAAGDLDQPISSGNRGEEIEALAAMFNVMQQRISGLINELKGVVNNVAHDLRMPITRMRGVAETTLTRDADLTSYRDMAVTVIEETDRLVGQVNTILELAEIDAGLKVMTMEQVDLARIVSMAVELYQPAAEDGDISLTVQNKKQPFFVIGNLNSLQRLLANLLDNAVKFTPPGGQITIALASEEGDAVLSVADNGPGISQKDRERIFDRFYRGDASRSISGNGLGLALVKSIAEKHHGTVTLDSDGKSGSCFIVKIPH
jgi:signal transduction histidine kinase